MKLLTTQLWMTALEEHLNEQTYDASEADLGWSITQEENNRIDISFEGYNDKAPVLVAKVAD